MLKSVIHIKLYDKTGQAVESFSVDEKIFELTKSRRFQVAATKLLERAIECTKFGGAVTIQRGFEL